MEMKMKMKIKMESENIIKRERKLSGGNGKSRSEQI